MAARGKKDMVEGSKRILLAGRRSYERMLQKSFFEREGCSIVTADDAEQMLDALDDSAPHLVVFEAELAPDNGPAVCGEIRKTPGCEETKLLLILPDAERKSLDSSRQMGADDVLIRPFEVVELLERTARLLEVPLRRDLRVQASLQIILRFGHQRVVGHTRNISSSGVLICVKQEVEFGAEVHFEFRLPGQTDSISGLAAVTRLDRKSYQPELGIGLTYVSLGPLATMKIRDFVEGDESP
jgi:DNA-binding response OmpR family regulator